MRQFCIIGMVALLAGSAHAQDNPLQFFPETTALVLRLKEPDRTIEKATQLADAVQPGTGSLLTQGAQMLGQAISNPSLTGVDQTKDWYVGVVLAQAGQPVPVFAIPALDAAALVDAVDEQMETSVQGKWVLYTEKPNKIPGASGANITSKLTGRSAEFFGAGEIGVFVNAAHLTAVYENELEQLKEQANDGLNQLRFSAPNGTNLEPFIQMYSEFAEYFFHGLEDTSSLTIAATFGEKGLQFEDYLVVKEGSSADDFLARYPAKAMPLLDRLPRGQQAYYGLSGGLKAMMKMQLEMAAKMQTDLEARKKAEALVKSQLERMNSIEFQEVAASIKFGGEPFLTATSLLQSNGDVKSLMRELQASGALSGANGVKQTTELKQDAEKIGEQSVDLLTVKQEFSEDLDPTGMQSKMLETMFGPNGIQTRVLYGEDLMFSTTGTLSDLESLVRRSEGTSSNGLDKVRETLPKEANLTVLLDMPILVGQFLKMLGNSGQFPIPIDGSMIDNLNLQQSYIGFAVATEPHAVRCRTEIPIEQIQGCVKLGMMIALTAQQANGGF
ncbi:MAG: hypothetical protein KDA90_05710 [Planctomycetaceae bacterium]|nr:hypothetical protein [Planctomycetaceae bacterium]